MKISNRGKVVCCPRCGTCATVSEISMDRFVCKNKDCNTKFEGWVVNGFVITFEVGSSEEEDYLRKFETCKDKLQKLNDLK